MPSCQQSKKSSTELPDAHPVLPAIHAPPHQNNDPLRAYRLVLSTATCTFICLLAAKLLM